MSLFEEILEHVFGKLFPGLGKAKEIRGMKVGESKSKNAMFSGTVDASEIR